MDETNKRYDLGEKALKPGQSVWLNYDRFDMPEGDYRLYAERAPDKPLNERMAHYWGGWWGPHPSTGIQRASRMQLFIDEFGLVERSKLPDPVAVPEWVQQWLDDTIGPIDQWTLKAWIGEAVIAGAVRVETPDVPDEVKKAAAFVTDSPCSSLNSLFIAEYVLDRV
ncbi:MAG: hypothetical protein GY701_31720, partial [Sulfitobacter sp.]|nr:hypothetical protein [Sulfitobacter sp.]